MRIRWRLLWSLAVWLCPATVALDLASCNDGSTGCCMVCPECACGNSCTSCAVRCTEPKGCACGNTTELTRGGLVASEPMSVPPDAGVD